MDTFLPFPVKIEHKGKTYQGTISPFSGRLNGFPYFFRVYLNNTYMVDVSIQHGYWKNFNEGADQSLVEKVCDYIEAYYE
jgi:hypothetical protein